ncbi:hypothetical protein [Streptomyces sp. NPDC006645]|uniref:hypothetical protein n=1 Tax=unclassified Streptomyces TaxID=2593676 RepID=UPI0033A8B891
MPEDDFTYIDLHDSIEEPDLRYEFLLSVGKTPTEIKYDRRRRAEAALKRDARKGDNRRSEEPVVSPGARSELSDVRRSLRAAGRSTRSSAASTTRPPNRNTPRVRNRPTSSRRNQVVIVIIGL